MRGRTRGIAALGAGLALTLGFVAHAGDTPDFSDVVPGHPGVTYFDLVKQAIPDLVAGAKGDLTGHLARLLPHLAGKSYEGEPPDPVTPQYLEVANIKAGGRPRLALLTDLGEPPDRAQSTTLLALYDDAPRPKLLDWVDVGVDKDTSFTDQKQLKLGPGDDALITYSEHFNTSQTYSSWLLVLVRNDRFRLVEQLFALSHRECGWTRQETPTFTTRPDPGQPLAAIDVVVRVAQTRTDEDCGDDKIPRPFARTYRAEFRWDAAHGRYRLASGNLAALDAINKDF